MTFSQYEGYLYMYILFLTMIPAVILGLLEKKIKYYGMLATAFMIYLIIGINVQFSFLVGFMVWEIGLILIFIKVERFRTSKWIFRLFLFASMLPLIVNKISPLTSMGPIGFIGISYLSFRTIQIIIEIYDGAIKDIRLFDTLYFILFFPTLSSGPIDRSRRFDEEINSKITRNQYIEMYLVPGVYKIFLGVMYKFVIAIVIHMYWIEQISSKPSIVSTILYMYGYTLYLFFDFAGYSLIAVGTSYIFGFLV